MAFKQGDAVKLAGTRSTTGVVASVEGETVTVTWDDTSAGLSPCVQASALEPAKKGKAK